MIRTYSDELIVLEPPKPVEGRNGISILCEATLSGITREIPIRFYERNVEKAARDLIVGTRFAYRGYVEQDNDGSIVLVAVTFTPIA